MSITRKRLQMIVKSEVSRLLREGMFDDIVDTPSTTAVAVRATINLSALGLGTAPISVKVVDEVRSFSGDIAYAMVGSEKFYISGPDLDAFRAGQPVTLETYLASGTSGSASTLSRVNLPITLRRI